MFKPIKSLITALTVALPLAAQGAEPPSVSPSVRAELGDDVITKIQPHPGKDALLLVSYTDIPHKNDSFFTQMKKMGILNGLFRNAGIDPSAIGGLIMEAKEFTHDNFPDGSAKDQSLPSGQNIIYYKNESFSDESLSFMTGWRRVSMERIPGTNLNHIAYNLHHEKGHAIYGTSEATADRYAFINSHINPDYLHAVRAMRIMFDMRASVEDGTNDEVHANIGMKILPGDKGQERFPESASWADYKEAVSSVQRLLYETMGKATETAERRLMALDKLFPTDLLNDSARQEIAFADTPEKRTVALYSSGLNTEEINIYLREVESRNVSAGFYEAGTNNQKVYQTARSILPEVVKQGDPVQIPFLTLFIDGIERYQPKAFHVPEKDIKSNTPITDSYVVNATVRRPLVSENKTQDGASVQIAQIDLGELSGKGPEKYRARIPEP